MEFKKTIGIEVHAQIDTKTKLFSRALVDDMAKPNSQVDFLDAGFPGTLPVPNKQAILMALKTCLALNMEINNISIFDRKHYFYQDLPLGYQITQFYKPIGINGYIDCSFGRVRINRLHIECDAGKSIYKDGHTFIDLNRAGVGLMEIVTEPDLHTENEVIEFMKELRAILLAIKTCKADMEKGNLRADVNLSVAKEGDPLGTRVEIKNLNSFSTIKKAITYEEQVQIDTILSGKEVDQCTKLYDSEKNITKTIRAKENAMDYAYFPDADLLPVFLSDAIIEETKNNLPMLPKQMREYLSDLGVAKEQAYILTETSVRFDFFNELLNDITKYLAFKVSNWVCSELLGKLSKLEIELEDFLIGKVNFSSNFAKIINLFESGEITRTIAKTMIDHIIEKDLSFDVLFKNSDLLTKCAINLDALIIKILNNSPSEVEKFKKGKVQIVMYFVGIVMKETKGQINAELIKEKVLEQLNLFINKID